MYFSTSVGEMSTEKRTWYGIEPTGRLNPPYKLEEKPRELGMKPYGEAEDQLDDETRKLGEQIIFEAARKQAARDPFAPGISENEQVIRMLKTLSSENVDLYRKISRTIRWAVVWCAVLTAALVVGALELLT